MRNLSSQALSLFFLLAAGCGYNPQLHFTQDGSSGSGGTSAAGSGGRTETDASNAGDSAAGSGDVAAVGGSGGGPTGGNLGGLAAAGGASGTGGAISNNDARPDSGDGGHPDVATATGGSGGGPTGGNPGSGGLAASGGAMGSGGSVTTGGASGTGGTTVTYDAGRDLSVDIPVVLTTCPALDAPANGSVNPYSREVGARATYACNTGYGSPIPSSRDCQADGTWSGTPPACNLVDCHAPAAPPDHGAVSAPITTYQAQATYSCDPNYGLVGDAKRSCQANGTWSGTTPTCPCVQSMCYGSCVNLGTDKNNCGGCGKTCSAVSPSTAACTPAGCLVTLAPATDPDSIAVDSANVYWTDDNAGNSGTVMKVPLGGGVYTTLASDQHFPKGIAVDATNVYWASSNYGTDPLNGAVMKVPLAGGLSVTLAPGENGPCCLAVNATDLYYIDYRGVVQIPLAGGPSSAIIFSSGASFNALALDAMNLYWRVDLLDGTLSAKIMKQALQAGSTPTTLVTSSSMGEIAVDASNVYWTMPAGTTAGAGSVAKVPIAGGATMTLASGLTEPTGLATDGTNLYWANYASGTVMKVPVAGGTPTTLASSQDSPLGIALDATSVYWTNWGGGSGMTGSVMKLSPR